MRWERLYNAQYGAVTWDSEFEKVKYKCKCGHTLYIPKKVDKIICTHCGNYFFPDKEKEKEYRAEEFKRKFREMERKLKNEK